MENTLIQVHGLLKPKKRCSKSKVIWSPSEGYTRVPKTTSTPHQKTRIFITHQTTPYTVLNYKEHQRAIDLFGSLKRYLLSNNRYLCTWTIYAGAQKNLQGPSGVTVIILSPWAVERSRQINAIRRRTPSMLNYGLMVD